MKVAILYRAVMNLDLETYLVGGVESYVFELARLGQDLGYETKVFQLSNKAGEVRAKDISIVGIGHADLWGEPPKVAKLLHDASEQWRSGEDGITVFALDHFSVPPSNPRSIVIQHGIEFDLPLPTNPFLVGPAKKMAQSVLKSNAWGRGLLSRRLESIVTARSAKFRRLFDQVPYRVCVDHNYMNWYRTQPGYVGLANYWVIPNFCRVVPRERFEQKLAEPLGQRILFARRFVHYRGAAIMVEVTPKILENYPEATLTFAGEGPMGQDFQELAKVNPRVRVTRYAPGEEADLLREHDISVIPSLGSEGTTLAAAEAMGAGCAVVATDVGGITNMILDGYNGLLVRPEPPDVYAGIDRLLKDPELHRRLTVNGYEVASSVFAVERWRKQWTEVFKAIMPSEGART